MTKLAIVILAAGESKRLGQAKQLVEIAGEPLIVHQCKSATATGYDVYCVLGCHKQQIAPLTAELSVEVIINRKWWQGMGSSIACAIKHIEQKKGLYEGALIMLADQWRLTTMHLAAMIDSYQRNKQQIVVAQGGKGDLTGPPVIFPQSLFCELKQLSGDEGAKSVIKNNKKRVQHFKLHEAFIDLDTPEQLIKMQASSLQ